MALVAYDYEDSESDQEAPEEAATDRSSAVEMKKIEDSQPEPVKPPTVRAEPALIKPIKERGKVKISVPLLTNFESDEEDEPQAKKKVQPSQKGSGLLSLLPPVKGTITTNKSFIPNSLKNKAANSGKVDNRMLPHALKRRAEMQKQESLKKVLKTGSDSDEDVDIPETFNEQLWEKTCGRPLKKYKEPVQSTAVIESQPVDIAPEPSRPIDGLDNQAFKELVGKSKRPLNIRLIDVNEEDVIAEKDLILTKAITDPDSLPKPVIETAADPTKKKKHHITYLAEMAKAKEEEFANNWAASKYTRNQTRAKYGF